MSILLINEPPLQVLPSLACAIGLNEAILLQQVHYWLRHAKVKHNDKMWIYKTVDKWKEQDFPFWSTDTIKRAIRSLRKQEVLLVSKLASNSFNRVNHYSIDYVKLDEISRNQPVAQVNTDKGNMHQSTVAECTEHKGNMHQSDKGDMHQCLREYKETKKESNSNNKNPSMVDSIQSWKQPNLSEINNMLKQGLSAVPDITQSQYEYQVTKFKNFHTEQELKGSVIQTEARRKDLLAEWIERDYQHQKKNKAKTKPTANSKTDWSSVGVKPSDSDNDFPDVFHPSHSSPVITNQPLFLNGLKREPFSGMTTDESYALVDKNTQIGEPRVAAYDRLLNQMQESV
ncbi:hypothetical protein [Psychrobacter sp. 16-MNA-CIBAN-0192]|uniref:hypothetical protein n=1 Tax=Psychrobacter sp. 16-MNA-CIBAN-0192 TaxID=3140448 RepID=UPI0033286686